ncbi:hypothetical protein AAFF_G00250430 [Aldrovandia affinis]|uniref:Ig-like domain-containing protein n=1 Tax=Aldrovandia affinis TaxID=143900 RepID=A0AAD7RCU1_9TELE|nr:hypothetical protein AAFF_G00250430 [Aldrovandia affinis]
MPPIVGAVSVAVRPPKMEEGVLKLSVPEGHHITLICPGHALNDSAPLEWKDRVGQVIATKSGRKANVQKEYKYSLLGDGSLFVKSLQQADSGQYHCDNQLVADVEVLTGQDFVVGVGRTVLLACKVTEKHRERWARISNQPIQPIQPIRRKLYILENNGTVTKKMNDQQNRFTLMEDSALRIANLRAVDAGEYWCNGKKAAKLTVRTETPDYTNKIADSAEETDAETDAGENDDTGHGRVRLAVLIGLCVLVLLAGALFVLLLTRNRNRKGKEQGPAEPDSHCLPDQVTSEEAHGEAQGRPLVEAGEIHYASLGRQNWREGPRAQGESQHVIYSTVVGGPEVDNTKQVIG